MKRIIMAVMAIAISVSASAMSLKDAFTALSNIPHVSVSVDCKPAVYSIDMKTDSVGPFKVAKGYRLNMQQILETGNAAFAILNQVPLRYMINGACNGEVAAFLYATPNADGSYDLLVAAMSGFSGDVSFLFMTINEGTLEAFQEAKVSMRGDRLSICPEKRSVVSAFDIRINWHYN